MRQSLHGRVLYDSFHEKTLWVGHEEPLWTNFVLSWELWGLLICYTDEARIKIYNLLNIFCVPDIYLHYLFESSQLLKVTLIDLNFTSEKTKSLRK